MLEPGALSRQPDTLKELQANKMRLAIYTLPTVNYTCTRVDIPGLALKGLSTPNPNTRLRFPGTVPEFSELEVTFLIDANLQNWLEIWDWMIAMTFPEDQRQRQRWIDNADSTFSNSTYPMHSDADVFVLTTQNNVLMEAHFMDVFPVQLSSIAFETTTTDAPPLVATVRFQYRAYEFRNRKTVE